MYYYALYVWVEVEEMVNIAQGISPLLFLLAQLLYYGIACTPFFAGYIMRAWLAMNPASRYNWLEYTI